MSSNAVPPSPARPGPGEITELLGRWRAGDRSAFEALTPMVYGELRRLARSLWRRSDGGMTLQPTAVVHELFLRLLDRPETSIEDRHHFFALAAKLLRQVLVDRARLRLARKRGGGMPALELDELAAPVSGPSVDLLALEDALERLAQRDPELERLVEMRYFAGLTLSETAIATGRSEASVSRDWSTARAFLFRELTRGTDRTAP